MGLLGEPIDDNSFLAGERFFDCISFLGCAPNLPLSPGEGDGYLRILLLALDEPTLFLSKKVHPVICPTCKTRIDNWAEHIVAAKASVLSCPQCVNATPLQSLNFRKRACFSRTIMQIFPVFEAEANPADWFVNALNQEFDAAFKVAFIQVQSAN
jgi:hypothetical protein